MSSIARSALLNLVFRVAGVVLSLTITVITARLGAEERGSYSLLTLSAAILITLFSGLGPAIAHRISHYKESAAPLVADGLVFSSIVGLGVGALLLLVVQMFPFPPYEHLQWLAIAAPFLMWTTVANGVYLGIGRMLPLNINTISASTLLIILCVLGILLSPPLQLSQVLIAWAIAQVLAGLVATYFVWRLVGMVRPVLRRLLGDARFITNIGIANVISTLNYRADLFLVQLFMGLTATGVYSIAIAVAEMLWFISSSLTIAAYQRIGTSSGSESASLTLRVVWFNFTLLLIASPLLAALAWLGLPWMVGDEYRVSSRVLLVLLPGVVMYGAASSLSAYFTNQLGRPTLSTRIALISLALNVAGSVILIPVFGIYGGALATSIAYMIAMLVALKMFSDYSGIPLRTIFSVNFYMVISDVARMLQAGYLWLRTRG